MKNEDRVREIEKKLGEVERVRPGRWFIALGSGQNVCTAVFAELISPTRIYEGRVINNPDECEVGYDAEFKCRRASSVTCEDGDNFPDGCPLEPSRVDTAFVLDCLPDYIFKDYPTTPEHGPLLKFFETIKGDVRFLIDETRKLREVLSKAEAALGIAASYDPDEWPTVGLKIHCQDARKVVSEIAEVSDAMVTTLLRSFDGDRVKAAEYAERIAEARGENADEYARAARTLRASAKVRDKVIRLDEDRTYEALVELVEQVESGDQDYLGLAVIEAKKIIDERESES